MKRHLLIVTAFAALTLFFGTAAKAGDPASLFKSKKCKACHKLTKDHTAWTVGPGLKGIGKRVSREYLEKMLTDPEGAIAAGGPEVEILKKGKKFKAKLKMPKAIKKLTESDVKALVEYILTL